MDAVPVISRGHNVAAFVAPVARALTPLLDAVARHPALVLVADTERALELDDALDQTHDQRRGISIVSTAAPRRQVPTPADRNIYLPAAVALQGLKGSWLKVPAFGCLVIAWPEQFDDEARAALEAVLAEADKDAQRIIVTARPGEAVTQLVERYAFKAMTYGLDAGPASPLGEACFILGGIPALRLARSRVRDTDGPGRAARVVPCPASREEAASLVEPAQGDAPHLPPVIVAMPHQLPWLRTLYQPLKPFPVPAAADASARRADQLRSRLATLLAEADLDAELTLLAPLLEEHDAALVAAAALRLGARGRGGAERAETAAAAPASGAAAPGSVSRLWIGIGRRDNVKPGDLVGALANEARVPAEAIGRIEVRDLFCLVEVRSEHADQAVKGLTGVSIRGRRLVARLDRGPGAKPPRRV